MEECGKRNLYKVSGSESRKGTFERHLEKKLLNEAILNMMMLSKGRVKYS